MLEEETTTVEETTETEMKTKKTFDAPDKSEKKVIIRETIREAQD